MFLTVDLYESKDPAQVLQCLGAFSRAASKLHPSRFRNPIGGKRGGVLSPQGTGTPKVSDGSYEHRRRGVSNASQNSAAYNSNIRPNTSTTPTQTGESPSGRWSPTKNIKDPASPDGVSSWSKKSDEGVTSPAWNISQYGYMGGASQGNLGVSFGGRRQITSAGPNVPSLAEKEKKRKEEDRLRLEAEKADRKRHVEEEERLRIEEEQRWAEEAKKLREVDRQRAAEEQGKWEEEERRWKMEEEKRQQEERDADNRLQAERPDAREASDARLRGHLLSQYQVENEASGGIRDIQGSNRIKELERELELARERERHYEKERQARLKSHSRQTIEDHDLVTRVTEENQALSRSRPGSSSRKHDDEIWREDERGYLRQQWNAQQNLHESSAPQPFKSPRPLPDPTPAPQVQSNHTGSRPLPNPTTYSTPAPASASGASHSFSAGSNRTDRYLSSNPGPEKALPTTTYSNEIGGFDSAAERDAEDRRRVQSQQRTIAGGWASKSLLEREMEMERQRQREWEESQNEVKTKVPMGDGVDGIGGGIGGKWDVNQWTGYTGGDSQNQGAHGIGSGRRQIVGPRPPPPGR